MNLGSTLGFLPFTDLVLSFVGMHFAWAYLRFFQRIDGSRGDSSESFSYLALLPEFLRPYIRPLFCHIHNAASQLGVLPTGQFQPIIPLNTNEKVEVSQIDRHRYIDDECDTLNDNHHIDIDSGIDHSFDIEKKEHDYNNDHDNSHNHNHHHHHHHIDDQSPPETKSLIGGNDKDYYCSRSDSDSDIDLA
eukprot:Pgem_evm1s506